MKKLLLLFFLISSTSLFTQTKTFVRDYTYNASEADSKLSSRTLALQEVKVLLLEEIGTYLSSEFETKTEQNQINGQISFKQLTKSKITTLAAGITNTKILKEKWNGSTYYIKAEIIVDIQDAKKKLNTLVNDKSKTKELEDLENKNKEATAEIEALQKELETAKALNKELSEAEKNRIHETYSEKINALNALEWFELAYEAYLSGEYKSSVEYAFKGIELDPKEPALYFIRGMSRHEMQNYTRALEDFNILIELMPKEAEAYLYRGLERYMLTDTLGALSDYNKAIELNPSIPDTYIYRASINTSLQNYSEALMDYDKVIELLPENGYAYYVRGTLRHLLNREIEACQDWVKAKDLGYSDSQELLKEFCK